MTKFGFLAISVVAGVTAFVASSEVPAQAVGGDKLFAQRCAVCHKTTPGAPNTVGPNLSGISKRKAGMAAFNYSPALKKAALPWNAANLDKYLAAPSKAVPGTRMVVAVADPVQRKAIVAYLMSLK
jgi:cytochrome c